MLFAFKIFSLPVPTRPGTRTFLQVPDPSRPEVKNPYPSDPAHNPIAIIKGSGCARKGDLEHKHKDIYAIHAVITPRIVSSCSWIIQNCDQVHLISLDIDNHGVGLGLGG